MSQKKIIKDVPKLNLIFALAGIVILFLLLFTDILTFELLLDSKHNKIRCVVTHIYIFGYIPMAFLTFGFSIVSIIISIICLFNRTYNYKNIIALLVSLITLGIFLITFVYERNLINIIF